MADQGRHAALYGGYGFLALLVNWFRPVERIIGWAGLPGDTMTWFTFIRDYEGWIWLSIAVACFVWALSPSLRALVLRARERTATLPKPIRHQREDDEVERRVLRVSTTADTGRTFFGARIFLESPKSLHDEPGDDDRSAITFWGPRERVAALLREAARVMSLDRSDTRRRASHNGEVCVDVQDYCDKLQAEIELLRSERGLCERCKHTFRMRAAAETPEET